MIDKQLEIVRKMQIKYPDLCLGGSLGMLLHGVNVERKDRNIGDLDFVKPTDFVKGDIIFGNPNETSFDMTYQIQYEGFKVDVAISDEKHETIYYKSHNYEVLTLPHILGFKCLYAIRGSKKHIEDILFLFTKAENDRVRALDDLPF